MSENKKIVIFCSSSNTIDAKYNDAAAEFVKGLAGTDWSIVTGGGVRGTMGALSKAAHEYGVHHVGVIPKFMEPFVAKELSECVWTETMSERKEKMRDGTCVAVALPGGIGTMDELVETLTLAKLDKYRGRIFALNIDGFYDKFIELLDFFVDTEMLDERSRKLIAFPKTVDELLSML